MELQKISNLASKIKPHMNWRKICFFVKPHKKWKVSYNFSWHNLCVKNVMPQLLLKKIIKERPNGCTIWALSIVLENTEPGMENNQTSIKGQSISGYISWVLVCTFNDQKMLLQRNCFISISLGTSSPLV